MTKTGESPSPVETCDDRVPEGYCVAARRGGKLPEGSSLAQISLPRPMNPSRRTATGRVCVGKTKPGAIAFCEAATQRVSEPTSRRADVFGVGMGIRRRHGARAEARAGAGGEQHGNQSRHSSDEAGNERGAKGGRKVKA